MGDISSPCMKQLPKVNSRHVPWQLLHYDGLFADTCTFTPKCYLGAQMHSPIVAYCSLYIYTLICIDLYTILASFTAFIIHENGNFWTLGGHDRVFVSMVAAPLKGNYMKQMILMPPHIRTDMIGYPKINTVNKLNSASCAFLPHKMRTKFWFRCFCQVHTNIWTKCTKSPDT